MVGKARPLADKFFARFVVEDSSCWRWTGAMGNHGYGTIGDGGKNHLAHRVAYQLFRGPITEPTLDHVCRNRWCVNPLHLEPVSIGENVRRGMSRGVVLNREGRCMRGHPVNEENTYRNAKHEVTVCRPCRNERRRLRYANDAEYREREKAKSRAAASRRKLPGVHPPT